MFSDRKFVSYSGDQRSPISLIPRLHDEAGSTSWLDGSSSARRAHVVRS